MLSPIRFFPARRTSAAVALSASLVLAAVSGCKSAPNDATLDKNVHAALSGDPVIAQQPVQVAVQNGVVTLTGNVSDATARNVAAQDAAHVQGVKEVVNNLMVQGTATTPTITSPSAPDNPTPATPAQQAAIAEHRPVPPPTRVSPARSSMSTAPSATTGSSPATAAAPAPIEMRTPPPPPPPPAPVVHTLTVPDGTALSVRVTQTLDSANAQPGESFSGVVARDIVVDGITVLPSGAAVTGRVVDVKDATHFKGSSMLSVELTGVRRHGETISLHTDPYSVEGKGRGTNTAEKVGGGAAVGAILGGIFGGGKGAAIGAAAGGGAGAGVQGMTRGQQVQIPSESIVRFRLTSGFTVRTTETPSEHHDRDGDTPGLQPR